MAKTVTPKRPDWARRTVRLDKDSLEREFYATRALAALRQGLETDRVDWRIEPEWDGFTVYGDPGDPLIMPIVELRSDNTLVAIGENFHTSGFIGDLSEADRAWYSDLLRVERGKFEAKRKVGRNV